MRIGVHGASGRMGRLVLETLRREPDIEVVWACGQAGPDSWEADVIIDFSTPAGFERLLQQARGPVVSGTTGVQVPENPTIPLLHAPNFSLGVAVLARLVAEANRLLPHFDAEIIEIHHSAKRDAPSGTALRLAAALGQGRPLRNGRTGPREPREVGMHAVRGGTVVGEHTVLLAGTGERLELRHSADSRDVFVQGAVTAARWLPGRPAGRYRIEDVLDPSVA